MAPLVEFDDETRWGGLYGPAGVKGYTENKVRGRKYQLFIKKIAWHMMMTAKSMLSKRLIIKADVVLKIGNDLPLTTTCRGKF